MAQYNFSPIRHIIIQDWTEFNLCPVLTHISPFHRNRSCLFQSLYSSDQVKSNRSIVASSAKKCDAAINNSNSATRLHWRLFCSSALQVRSKHLLQVLQINLLPLSLSIYLDTSNLSCLINPRLRPVSISICYPVYNHWIW